MAKNTHINLYLTQFTRSILTNRQFLQPSDKNTHHDFSLGFVAKSFVLITLLSEFPKEVSLKLEFEK